MATKPATRPDEGADRDENKGAPRQAAIARAVLDALGRPADLLTTTVRPVGGDNYRVNVVAGPDIASARIAHSFFLTADDKGHVTTSTPAIRKCY